MSKEKDTTKVNIDINNMSTEKSFIVIHNLIHKAQQKGAFLLDEAVVAKYALLKLQTSLNLNFDKKKSQKK